MSKHQEWKMVHLLYTYARRTGTGDRRILTEQTDERGSALTQIPAKS